MKITWEQWEKIKATGLLKGYGIPSLEIDNVVLKQIALYKLDEMNQYQFMCYQNVSELTDEMKGRWAQDKLVPVYEYSHVYISKFFIENNRQKLKLIEGLNLPNIIIYDYPDSNFEVDAVPRKEQISLFEDIRELYKEHEFVSLIIKAIPGWGKLEPLRSKILTPNGWSTMGEIKKGDYVVSRDGYPTKVLDVFPQGVVDIYTVYFADGTYAECGLEHLWGVFNRQKKNKYEVKTLEEIMKDYIRTPEKTKYGTTQQRPRYAVPLCEPVIFDNSEKLPIHPYALAMLIADGSFRSSHLEFADKYNKNIDSLLYYLRQIDPDLKYSSRKKIKDDIHKETNHHITSSKIKDILKDLGLGGKLSIEKYIPEIYLKGTPLERRAFLQGLMDTDSHKPKNRKGSKGFNPENQTSYEYYTSSKKLMDNFLELVRSLGIYCNKVRVNKDPKYTHNDEIRTGNDGYRVLFSFNKNKKTIVNITKNEIKEESQCIKVDNPEHLYITRDYTVTHNTFAALKIASDFKNKTLIILPNDVLEKQWMGSINDFSNCSYDDIGVINGSNLKKLSAQLEKDIIVCKVQSLMSQIKQHSIEELQEFYKDIGIVFYDEAHVSASATAFSHTSFLFKTPNIIELTATPFNKGTHEFLMMNTVNNHIWESDHQNLIPTINVHNPYIAFSPDQIGQLDYFKGIDYTMFLAKYNSYLYDNYTYLTYLAQWAAYRTSEGHKVAILFSTNKLIERMYKILLDQFGLDFGIIIGKTEKAGKMIDPTITNEELERLLLMYKKVYPKRTKEPKWKIGAKFTKPIKEMIIKHSEDFPEDEQFIIRDAVKPKTEMQIAKEKIGVISNFQSMAAGYDDSKLGCILFGSPVVGKKVVIQSLGRTTRVNNDKPQDIQSHFFFSTYYTNSFPDMRFILANNIKTQYKDAKFNYEGFEI